MDDWEQMGYEPYTKKDLDLVIEKALILCSILNPGEQVEFLGLLVSATDPLVKGELVERAIIGERVWQTLKPSRRHAG